MQKYIDRFNQMIALRCLTDHTLKSYSSYLSCYLNYLSDHLSKLPEEVSWDELRVYIFYLKDVKKLNPRSINAHISQLRFFYLYVLHKPWDRYQVPFLKYNTYLPTVLSQEEVSYFIDTLQNLKHKAIVAVLYSSGLRVGEVCHLKYRDINRKNMTIHVTHGKNRSDRYAILSKKALDILTDYWFEFGKPMDWLFPSRGDSNKPIVNYTVTQLITTHEKRLGWEKRITCHTFRHCFGTHLYENGADLLTIKNLLGHKSLNSSTIYVHLGNHGKNTPISPFDLGGQNE